jgi:DNA-binding NtrC family response regulator
MARILIVEDDRITAWALERAVTRMGHLVVACTFSVAKAMVAVYTHHPDVVLLDIGLMGPQDGLLVGQDIQTFWSAPIIYTSGSDLAQLGIPDGPHALWCYLAKPLDWRQLEDILAQLFPTPQPRPRAPWSSLEDTPPPICFPTQALREQLQYLREPVRAF